ncbi:MAG: Ig-like domain-containing protein [Burkholderiaceae bacterium]|nr:Ig-like domain-containing protein [Burkholderiaceae bacterium]
MTTSSLKGIVAAVAAVLVATLAGCGGGGAGGQGATGGATSTAVLEMTTSTPTLGTDGKTTATITAFAKDSSNRALANQQVDFATTDSGAQLLVVSARTDATGAASATLSVSDQRNRTITVTGASGAATKSVNVMVVGTTLALNGPGNAMANSPTEYTLALRDSSGQPLAGRAVAVTSSAGNTLSSASVTTDVAGQAKLLLTGTKVGSDTLTVSALGASASIQVTVAASQLTFSSPAPDQEITVAANQNVTVRYLLNGLPQSGQTMQLFATRGTITPSSGTTDAAGQVSASISSPTAGVSTITATVGGVIGSQRVEFVSRTPAKITLQSSPSNVGVNLSPSGTNSSQLIAVVRDAADNPVKGRLISFFAASDPSNGRIEPAVATTDSAGVAIVTFYPGANSTGNNQIDMRATSPGTGLEGRTTLTATRQELFVRIGTGNVVEPLTPTSLGYPWSAVVSDASGNPVAGATIQASLVGSGMRKGRYVWSELIWVTRGEGGVGSPIACPSEDANDNLRLDVGEDVNGNGTLDPGNFAVAEVTSIDGKTDSTGLATLRINYPRSFGNWGEVRLRVTITAIAGTEGTAQATFLLPALSADLTSETVSPPGYISPFGEVADCSNPN